MPFSPAALFWGAVVGTVLFSPLLACNAAGTADPELQGKVDEWLLNKEEATSKYGAIGTWDTSKTKSMAGLFQNKHLFDEDLSAWNVSSVTSFSAMFNEAAIFTSNISSWDVSNSRDFTQMFHGARKFESDLSLWNVASMTAAVATFHTALLFTSDLSSWDVSQATDLNYMFSDAQKFTTNVSKWQVSYGTTSVAIFRDTQLLADYEASLPCWSTAAPCPLPITFAGARQILSSSQSVTTVDPTKMSATNPYRVGTTYRFPPLNITVETDHVYSLVDSPEGFYINSDTGVVIGTFGADDITVGNSINGTTRSSKEPITVTLQVIARSDNRRAVVENYTMHVADRETFELMLGDRVVDRAHRDQYLNDDGIETATVLLVNTPFRIAARLVDQHRTVLSGGGFDDITYTFKVSDTATGAPRDAELDRLSMKRRGEILGEFSEHEVGNLTIIITATDGGGEHTDLIPILLDIRQLDVNIPKFGPNSRGCANAGSPVDDSGDLYDGVFTSCDCDKLPYVGENCESLCARGGSKDYGTGKCVYATSYTNASANADATSAILASIAGVVLLGLLFAAGAARYHRYRLKMQPVDFDKLNLKMLESGTILADQLFSECKPRELKRSTVTLLEQVGSGSFGAVWKATLDESNTTPEYQVAAKTVLEDAPPEARADLATEAAVMAQLAGHKNLVSIIGVVTSGNPLILVLSFCDHGSLLSFLTKKVAAGKAVSALHKIDFAAQTARGMEHLASRHFVHRDLAARNVLLASGKSASNLICKVADFGLSRVGRSDKKNDKSENEDYYRSTKGIFPVRWTAPEAMESLIFNQASDVWSFGILLIEIVQDGDRPYHNSRINSEVMALTMSGRRHRRPPGCSGGLYSIMMRCWDANPTKRPTFTEVASEIDQLYIRATVWGEDIEDDASGSNGPTSSSADFTAKQELIARSLSRSPSRSVERTVGSSTSDSASHVEEIAGVEYELLVRGDVDGSAEHTSAAQYARNSDPNVVVGTAEGVTIACTVEYEQLDSESGDEAECAMLARNSDFDDAASTDVAAHIAHKVKDVQQQVRTVSVV
jgi:serine/threonine protein kinase